MPAGVGKPIMDKHSLLWVVFFNSGFCKQSTKLYAIFGG